MSPCLHLSHRGGGNSLFCGVVHLWARATAQAQLVVVAAEAQSMRHFDQMSKGC
jgi:hypothetical protein